MANVDTSAPVGSVAWAQASLNALGANPPVLVDGVLREETEREILALQKASGGEHIDGKLNAATTAAIFVALASKAPAKPVVATPAPAPTVTGTVAKPFVVAPVVPAKTIVEASDTVKMQGTVSPIKPVMPIWPSLTRLPGENDVDYKNRNDANLKSLTDDWVKANS